MHTMNTCDRVLLVRYLKGELGSADELRLVQHLDDCTICQRDIEQAAGAPEWWQQARTCLSPVSAENYTHDGDLASSGLSTEDEEGPTPGQISLDFLAPTDDPANLGRVGPYEIVGLVGRGGTGIVLKGHDRSLNRFVAVKILAPYLGASAAARRRFAREAQAAAAVVHEHIVPIHAVAEHRGLPYLVMQYVAGRSLQQRLEQQGPLELKEILRIGLQTAAGLGAAHAQGLVHRDVKPANILLENGIERVLLTDFGLARAVDDASLTCSGVIAGTPEYMAPEQARGEAVDHRTDLFCLGSVLYAMCTGHSPFRAQTTMGVLHRICNESARPVRDVNPEIPWWLADIIRKLHSAQPSRRYASANDVAQVLQAHLADVQQPTRHKSLAERTGEIRYRLATTSRRARWIAASCALTLTIAAAGWSTPVRSLWARFWPVEQQRQSTRRQDTAGISPRNAINPELDAKVWQRELLSVAEEVQRLERDFATPTRLSRDEWGVEIQSVHAYVEQLEHALPEWELGQQE